MSVDSIDVRTNALLWFAQNRHRSRAEEQMRGDEGLLAVERTACRNAWAADVLAFAHAGRFTDAVSLLLKRPREVEMSNSRIVSYACMRHDAPPEVQRIFDTLFMAMLEASQRRLGEFEATKRALLAKLTAWLAQSKAGGRQHAHA